ncbi:MAG: hypothetical protein ACRENE_06460 [Polyangiaceae bacterium]
MMLALALAAYAGTADLSDAASVNLRTMTATPASVDLIMSPAARASVTDRRWELTASYAPLLYLTDVERGEAASAYILNGASLLTAWHDRLVRIHASEDASFGRQNTTYLGLPSQPASASSPGPAPTSPAMQLVPAQSTALDLASSRTTVGSDLRLSRRLQLALNIGYALFGGTDAVSQQTLPLQEGPFANASAFYLLSRADTLLVNASASVNDTERAPCPTFVLTAPPPAMSAARSVPTCAPDDLIASSSAGIVHDFTQATTGAVGAGASFVRSRLNPTDGYDSSVFPTGIASLQHVFALEEQPTTLHVDAQLGPFVDLRTGIPAYRVQANLSLSRHAGQVVLTELLGAYRSFGSILLPPATYWLSNTTVEYRATRNVSLLGSFNCVVEAQDGLATFLATITTLSVVVRTSPARF